MIHGKLIIIIIIYYLGAWFGDRNGILPIKNCLSNQDGVFLGKIGWLNKQMERRQLWASCSHTCPVTKQYNLVPAKRR